MADILRTATQDTQRSALRGVEQTETPDQELNLEQRRRKIEQEKAEAKATEEARKESEAEYAKEQEQFLALRKEFESTHVKLDTGEWIPKEDFEKLTPEEQEKLKTIGVDAFNDYYNKKIIADAGLIKLTNGEYVTSEEYNKLTPEEQEKLNNIGIDKFNTWYTDKKATEAGLIKLESGEWITKTEYDKLSQTDQQRLNKLGITEYNKVSGQEALQAAIDKVKPPEGLIKGGTGMAKGFTGQTYIRTARGDIPSWMLLADTKYAFVPSGSEAMGTSYGLELSNVRYPINHQQEYRVAPPSEFDLYAGLPDWQRSLYEPARGPIPDYQLHYRGSDGKDYWFKWLPRNQLDTTGEAADFVAATGITLTPIMWDEVSYLKWLGLPPNTDIKGVGTGSYRGADAFYNSFFNEQQTYIDPVTGETKSTDGILQTQGVLDTGTGKLVTPLNRHPVYCGSWTDRTRTYLQRTDINMPGTGRIDSYITDPRTIASKSAAIGQAALTYIESGQLPEFPLMREASRQMSMQMAGTLPPEIKTAEELTIENVKPYLDPSARLDARQLALLEQAIEDGKLDPDAKVTDVVINTEDNTFNILSYIPQSRDEAFAQLQAEGKVPDYAFIVDAKYQDGNWVFELGDKRAPEEIFASMMANGEIPAGSKMLGIIGSNGQYEFSYEPPESELAKIVRQDLKNYEYYNSATKQWETDLASYAYDQRNSGKTYEEIANGLKEANYDDNTINEVMTYVPPTQFANDNEFKQIIANPAQLSDYQAQHPDDPRLFVAYEGAPPRYVTGTDTYAKAVAVEKTMEVTNAWEFLQTTTGQFMQWVVQDQLIDKAVGVAKAFEENLKSLNMTKQLEGILPAESVATIRNISDILSTSTAPAPMSIYNLNKADLAIPSTLMADIGQGLYELNEKIDINGIADSLSQQFRASLESELVKGKTPEEVAVIRKNIDDYYAPTEAVTQAAATLLSFAKFRFVDLPVVGFGAAADMSDGRVANAVDKTLTLAFGLLFFPVAAIGEISGQIAAGKPYKAAGLAGGAVLGFMHVGKGKLPEKVVELRDGTKVKIKLEDVKRQQGTSLKRSAEVAMSSAEFTVKSYITKNQLSVPFKMVDSLTGATYSVGLAKGKSASVDVKYTVQYDVTKGATRDALDSTFQRVDEKVESTVAKNGIMKQKVVEEANGIKVTAEPVVVSVDTQATRLKNAAMARKIAEDTLSSKTKAFNEMKLDYLDAKYIKAAAELQAAKAEYLKAIRLYKEAYLNLTEGVTLKELAEIGEKIGMPELPELLARANEILKELDALEKDLAQSPLFKPEKYPQITPKQPQLSFETVGEPPRPQAPLTGEILTFKEETPARPSAPTKTITYSAVPRNPDGTLVDTIRIGDGLAEIKITRTENGKYALSADLITDPGKVVTINGEKLIGGLKYGDKINIDGVEIGWYPVDLYIPANTPFDIVMRAEGTKQWLDSNLGRLAKDRQGVVAEVGEQLGLNIIDLGNATNSEIGFFLGNLVSGSAKDIPAGVKNLIVGHAEEVGGGKLKGKTLQQFVNEVLQPGEEALAVVCDKETMRYMGKAEGKIVKSEIRSEATPEAPKETTGSAAQRFAEMTEDQFNQLASQGSKSPYGMGKLGAEAELVEIQAVADGRKPMVVITQKDMRNRARDMGLVTQSYIDIGGNPSWIAFREGNRAIADKFINFKEKWWGETREGREQADIASEELGSNPLYHIEFGELLGYKDEDIAYFLKNTPSIGSYARVLEGLKGKPQDAYEMFVADGGRVDGAGLLNLEKDGVMRTEIPLGSDIKIMVSIPPGTKIPTSVKLVFPEGTEVRINGAPVRSGVELKYRSYIRTPEHKIWYKPEELSPERLSEQFAEGMARESRAKKPTEEVIPEEITPDQAAIQEAKEEVPEFDLATTPKVKPIMEEAKDQQIKWESKLKKVEQLRRELEEISQKIGVSLVPKDVYKPSPSVTVNQVLEGLRKELGDIETEIGRADYTVNQGIFISESQMAYLREHIKELKNEADSIRIKIEDINRAVERGEEPVIDQRTISRVILVKDEGGTGKPLDTSAKPITPIEPTPKGGSRTGRKQLAVMEKVEEKAEPVYKAEIIKETRTEVMPEAEIKEGIFPKIKEEAKEETKTEIKKEAPEEKPQTETDTLSTAKEKLSSNNIEDVRKAIDEVGKKLDSLPEDSSLRAKYWDMHGKLTDRLATLLDAEMKRMEELNRLAKEKQATRERQERIRKERTEEEPSTATPVKPMVDARGIPLRTVKPGQKQKGKVEEYPEEKPDEYSAAIAGGKSSVVVRPKTKATSMASPEAVAEAETQTRIQTKAKTDTKTATQTMVATVPQSDTLTKVEPKTKTETKTKVVPTTRVPVKTTVKTPPKTPPPKKITKIIPPELRFKELTEAQLLGAVAWKQGFIYKLWYPPYRQGDVINTKAPLPGVKYFKGVGSAAKSIVVKYGDIPPQIKLDMGIVDVDISRTRDRRKPKIKFRADPHQQTNYSGIITGR